jgi:hypothetical protein
MAARALVKLIITKKELTIEEKFALYADFQQFEKERNLK